MSSWTPTKYKTKNWSSYNDSLKRRGSLSIWFDTEMVCAPRDPFDEALILFNDIIEIFDLQDLYDPSGPSELQDHVDALQARHVGADLVNDHPIWRVLSQSFFLKNFVLRRTTFRPLECQIIQNFGHTRENFRKLDVQMCRAENKILVF